MMSILATTVLWKFLAAHQVTAAALGTTVSSWAFSAYASTVTAPPDGAPKRKLFWFRFVHSAAANLDKLRAS